MVTNGLSSHATDMRGREAGAVPGLPFGRFGRLLAYTPARRTPEQALRDLATAMIREDAGGADHRG